MKLLLLFLVIAITISIIWYLQHRYRLQRRKARLLKKHIESIDSNRYKDEKSVFSYEDAFKEFEFSIKEQTKGVKEALYNAFGIAFTDYILNSVKNGSINTSDALLKISGLAIIKELSAHQVQQLTAKLFKGAGEDAGGALKIFRKVVRTHNTTWPVVQKAVAAAEFPFNRYRGLNSEQIEAIHREQYNKNVVGKWPDELPAELDNEIKAPRKSFEPEGVFKRAADEVKHSKYPVNLDEGIKKTAEQNAEYFSLLTSLQYAQDAEADKIIKTGSEIILSGNHSSSGQAYNEGFKNGFEGGGFSGAGAGGSFAESDNDSTRHGYTGNHGHTDTNTHHSSHDYNSNDNSSYDRDNSYDSGNDSTSWND